LRLLLLRSAVEVGEIRSVVLDRCGVAADRSDRLIELGLAAAGNKYACPLFSEMFGDAENDTGAALGHQRYFACELAGRPGLLAGLLRADGNPRKTNRSV
jgi:hypothetical protein